MEDDFTNIFIHSNKYTICLSSWLQTIVVFLQSANIYKLMSKLLFYWLKNKNNFKQMIKSHYDHSTSFFVFSTFKGSRAEGHR